MVDDDILPTEAFTIPDESGDSLDPRLIARRLVTEEPAFGHLRDGNAGIMVLMRETTKIKNQKMILGEIALPNFTGSLGDVARWLLVKACDGIMPDYLLLLDRAWWTQASPLQREALVYHELCHTCFAVDRDGETRFTADGEPIWAIRGHDIEEFNSVVRRYGDWLPDVRAFAAALRDGGVI